MHYDERTLNAYIDGELDSEQTATIARAEARDSELRAHLDALRRSDRMLREACASIVERPLPASVTELLENSGKAPAQEQTSLVANAAQTLAGLLRPLPLPATGIAAGAAATLVAVYLALAPGEREETTLPQRIEAGTPFYTALQEQPSGNALSVNGQTLQPLLSFRTSDGNYCREFILSGDTQRRHAVACAGAGAWQVKASVSLSVSAGEAEGYIPASGESENAVSEFVDNHMAGIPMDRTREQTLIESGWKRADTKR